MEVTPRRAACVVVLALMVFEWRASAVPSQLVTSYWDATTTFPEKDAVSHLGGDLGVAFSGGGTRSASLTIGQLRGLWKNGWLKRVRYITAVSGGSWAAVPFTYAGTDLTTLLGDLQSPDALDAAHVSALAPEGALARSVAESNLLAAAAPDVLKIAGRRGVDVADLPAAARPFLEKIVRGSNDETFADILGRIFIKPHAPGALNKFYTWTRDERDRLKLQNPSLSENDFVVAAEGRPFLIVGGTLIANHPAYDYPRLIPVEMTPLYTGVRQRFGNRLGGVYVSPFAYGAQRATAAHDGVVNVKVDAERRPFTLADMIAISGSAPLLYLSRTSIPHASIGAGFFPAFRHFTIDRAGGANPEAGPAVDPLLHGDGGFTDNLGVMPLLARGVKNIIVFVNAADPLSDNPAVESLFYLLDRQEDAGGDRSANRVFESKRLRELQDGLKKAVADGGPAVYCGTKWDVLANEIYNVAPYTGLNICWVNNEKVPAWEKALPADTQALLAKKAFKSFPLFATYRVRLSAAQVNLLAHLGGWTVTHPPARDTIAAAIASALQ